MKELNGQEIADFIKQRQLRVSRSLRQAHGKTPKLVIVRTNPDPVVDVYMRLKKQYGKDIEVTVDILEIDQSEAVKEISRLNIDESVHGIIVQLPLANIEDTDKVLAAVELRKDVDGLAPGSRFTPPTVAAIDWLLVGRNVELQGKKVVIVGKGRLVGEPLLRYWQSSEYNVEAIDETAVDPHKMVSEADIVVSAVGKPGIISADMLKVGAIVVDAGASSGSSGLVGDAADDVRARQDVLITPKKGGVGPLTVAALFENLLQATQ